MGAASMACVVRKRLFSAWRTTRRSTGPGGSQCGGRKSGEAPASLFVNSADPDTEQFRDQLSGAMASLPDEQRTVVQLKLWGEMTFEQISEVQNISVNTAGSRYRYGIEKLRQTLAPIYREINE